MKYDRPQPHTVRRGAQRRNLTWSGIFAGNAPAPTALDKLVGFVKEIGDGVWLELDDHEVCQLLANDILRELGVIA